MAEQFLLQENMADEREREPAESALPKHKFSHDT